MVIPPTRCTNPSDCTLPKPVFPPVSSPLPAGGFSTWLRGVREALAGVHAADVPCGDCTACCASSQFVHIEPDETDTLAHIPPALLFPAPRMPTGHVLLGYDENGRCPMLGERGCSIYEHRPRTCRTYDCRVFPAAGVELDDDKVLIAEQARRWRFDFPTAADARDRDAVLAASRFLAEGGDLIPGRGPPLEPDPAGRARRPSLRGLRRRRVPRSVTLGK